MNAELTTSAVVAQNVDVAGPHTSQPVSINIPVPAATSAIFRIPAAIWCMLVAITSDMIGAYWDVAWHQSIGRDTFLDPGPFGYPALCGVLGEPYFRFSDTFHYIWPQPCSASTKSGKRTDMGLSRTAGSLHCRLGWIRHDHIRSFRQLVA
jgi:hypothetical protein